MGFGFRTFCFRFDFPSWISGLRRFIVSHLLLKEKSNYREPELMSLFNLQYIYQPAGGEQCPPKLSQWKQQKMKEFCDPLKVFYGLMFGDFTSSTNDCIINKMKHWKILNFETLQSISQTRLTFSTTIFLSRSYYTTVYCYNSWLADTVLKRLLLCTCDVTNLIG